MAKAYGVEVSALISAAEAEDQDDSIVVLPISGYVEAGTTPESETIDLGTISLPAPMIQGSPSAYFLVVSGDCLVPDGIHNGDMLLVYPGQPPKIGAICVVAVEGSLYAGTYITPGSVRLRTTTGSTVDMDSTPEQLVGTVAWHFRKI